MAEHPDPEIRAAYALRDQRRGLLERHAQALRDLARIETLSENEAIRDLCRTVIDQLIHPTQGSKLGSYVATSVVITRPLAEAVLAAAGVPVVDAQWFGACADCKFSDERGNDRGWGSPCSGCGTNHPAFTPKAAGAET